MTRRQLDRPVWTLIVWSLIVSIGLFIFAIASTADGQDEIDELLRTIDEITGVEPPEVDQDEPEEPDEAETPAIALTALEADLVARTNQHRINNGLQPLTVDAELMRQARIWTERMATGAVGFRHSGWGAENIAWHSNSQNGGDPVGRLMQQWRNSRGHNRNMLGNHAFIGVGVLQHGTRTYGTHRFSGSQPSYVNTNRSTGRTVNRSRWRPLGFLWRR